MHFTTLHRRCRSLFRNPVFFLRVTSEIPWSKRGLRCLLLPLALALVCFSLPPSAAQAQSGWYHCDIQDHSYTGPGTRYFCRPVSFDWLCNIARITDFCHGSSGNSRNSGDSRGKSDADSGDQPKSASLGGRVVSFGAGIYARQLDAAGIGLQWIIDAGFITAVDIWGSGAPGEVCLEGAGALLFIDTGSLPRTRTWLEATQRDGRSCATLDRPGILALLPARARYMHCRMSTTGNLRVRTGPSLDDDAIGYVRRGTTLDVLSRSGDWFNIDYEGEAGWVGAAYVREDCGGETGRGSGTSVAGDGVATAASQSQQCPVITTGNLRVRTGPSLDDEVIGYLRAGVTLWPLAQRGEWIEIDYQGDAGWIGSAYVAPNCEGAGGHAATAAPSPGCPVTTTGRLRVRAGPSLDDDTIGFVRSGVTLRPISRIGSWLSFDYQGETGWVGAGFVTESDGCG